MDALTDLRTKVAVTLDAGTWPVHDLPIESPSPPCFVLAWGEPWLEGPQTACAYLARLNVRAIAPRLVPDQGYDVLERMVGFAVGRLAEVGLYVREVLQPIPYVLNAVSYQSTLLTIVHTVSINHGGT